MLHLQYAKAELFSECMIPFQLSPDVSFSFTPKYEIGDHSYLCKISGNASSGFYRCFACNENFGDTSSLEWKPITSIFRKSLQEIIPFLKKEGTGKFGQLRIPGILRNDLETPLHERNLEELEFVHDPLHNVMGAAKDIYEQFKNESGFDSAGSEKAIRDLLNRDNTSKMSGGK